VCAEWLSEVMTDLRQDYGEGEAYVYLLTKTPTSPHAGQSGAGAADIAAAAKLDLPDSVFHGPGSYQIDPWVTDRHNLRAAPRLVAQIVGSLHAGDIVEVSRVVTVTTATAEDELAREHWAQLFRRSPGPPAWALLEDSAGRTFLRCVRKPGLKAANAASRTPGELEPAELDRNIAAILGSGEEGGDTVGDLANRIMEHEWQLVSQSVETKRLEARAAEAQEQRRQKKALQVVEDLSKVKADRQRKQKETWELERPQFRMRTVNALASLDQSCIALERQYMDKVAAVKDQHSRSRAMETELRKANTLTLADDEGPEDEASKQPRNEEDKATIAAEVAREAAEEAARGLTGVSDASLAEALVAMESASSHFYRKFVLKVEH